MSTTGKRWRVREQSPYKFYIEKKIPLIPFWVKYKNFIGDILYYHSEYQALVAINRSHNI